MLTLLLKKNSIKISLPSSDSRHDENESVQPDADHHRDEWRRPLSEDVRLCYDLSVATHYSPDQQAVGCPDCHEDERHRKTRSPKERLWSEHPSSHRPTTSGNRVVVGPEASIREHRSQIDHMLGH